MRIEITLRLEEHEMIDGQPKSATVALPSMAYGPELASARTLAASPAARRQRRDNTPAVAAAALLADLLHVRPDVVLDLISVTSHRADPPAHDADSLGPPGEPLASPAQARRCLGPGWSGKPDRSGERLTDPRHDKPAPAAAQPTDRPGSTRARQTASSTGHQAQRDIARSGVRWWPYRLGSTDGVVVLIRDRPGGEPLVWGGPAAPNSAVSALHYLDSTGARPTAVTVSVFCTDIEARAAYDDWIAGAPHRVPAGMAVVALRDLDPERLTVAGGCAW